VVLAPNEEARIPDEFLRDSRVIVAPTRTSAIAVKRNQGLKGEADFYACIDSDSYPRADWLKNAAAAFKKSSDIWAVGGPNVSPEYPSLKKRAVANALKSFLVGGPRVFVKRISSDRYVNDLQTCNLILSKKAIEESGGFDENFITAEDTDLCERIRRKGGRIYFASDVLVYHHNRSLFGPFAKQRIVFGYAVLPFIKKNFSLGKLFIFLPLLFVFYVLFGWTSVFFSRALFYFWVSSLAVYFGVTLIDAWRWSGGVKEIPLTFLAIVIGNIGPGIGTLLALLGVKINFSKFYVNYESR
jgi:GT2 family glycosyltransferase